MATLTRNAHTLIFEDSSSSRQPSRRNVDWKRQIPELPVSNPRNQSFEVQPGEEVSLFSGVRSLTLDDNTPFDLTLSPLSPTRYRMAWNGAGETSAPGFRTARAVSAPGGNIILAMNANLTMTVTSSLGDIFGDVSVGDTVLIPGASTGDTGPFNALNEGLWNVLAASASSLTLARLPGSVFTGISETVAVTDFDEFQVYSSTGVAVGDTLELIAGFSTASRRSYQIVFVAANYVEFESVIPLALQDGVVPGIAGIKVYSEAKRYVLIETDQEIAVKYNGATGEENRVEPILAGDPNLVGFDEKFGTVFSLAIKNRSTQTANVTFISAE
jgi:hypothetical protein